MGAREVAVAAKDLFAATSKPGAGEGLGREGWLDLLSETQAAMNSLAACQAVAMAQVAAFDSDDDLGFGPIRHRGLGHTAIDAPDLVAARIGCSSQAAVTRLSVAVEQVTTMPTLVSAMGRGRLDAYRAAVVTDELSDAPAATRAAVVDALIESGHLESETAAPLRRRARKVMGALAPDVLAARVADAVERRGLHRSTNALGVDHWEAWLPIESSRPAWAAVTTLAQSYLREHKASSVAQARADALTDLILGQTSTTIVMHPTVPVEDAATVLVGSHPESADDLVPVTGFGVAGQTLIRRRHLSELAALGRPRRTRRSEGVGTMSVRVGEALACMASSGAVTGVLTDGAGGECRDSDSDNCAPAGQAAPSISRPVMNVETVAPAEQTELAIRLPVTEAGQVAPAEQTDLAIRLPVTEAYRPSAELERLVKARDGRCRFPGCHIPVRFVDLDHVKPFDVGGLTAFGNLACLCRRHHRIKQRAGWRATLHTDGSMDWVDPSGVVRTTWPDDHRPTPRSTRHDRPVMTTREAASTLATGSIHPTGFRGAVDVADLIDPADLEPFSTLVDHLEIWLRKVSDGSSAPGRSPSVVDLHTVTEVTRLPALEYVGSVADDSPPF